jgi:hypothetical protein
MVCISLKEKIKLQRKEATTGFCDSNKQSNVTSLAMSIVVITFRRGRKYCPGQVCHAQFVLSFVYGTERGKSFMVKTFAL